MDILYLLIPLSVVLVFVIGIVFWYALRSGQFDDLEGPAIKVILDDDRPEVSGDRVRDSASDGGAGEPPPAGGERR